MKPSFEILGKGMQTEGCEKSRPRRAKANLAVKFADVPSNCDENALLGEFAEGFGFVGLFVSRLRTNLVFEELF